MSTTTLTMSTTSLTTSRTDKSSKKQTKVVVLALPSAVLKRFRPTNDSPSIASSPAPTIEDMPKFKTTISQENNSEATSTPAPMQDAPSPGGASKKNAATTNGVKRSTPFPDGTPKPRGKPGPKKKPRLEDGTIDHSARPANTSTANHKLGPKANTGFINANLRALDRTGTPCRKWQRRGFQLKSFTGVAWELPSWKGSADSALTNGTSDASAKDISMHGSSDQKPSESDTAAGSNLGDPPDRMDVSTPAASSPPPMLAPPPVSIPIQT